MNLRVSLLSSALFALLFIFSCKNDTVTSTGKALNDEKSEKLASGQPIYDNMEGIWISRTNPNRKLDLRGGKFKITEADKVIIDGEFTFYKQCPSGCFPDGMGGNTPCFSVRTSNDLHCYALRELTPDKALGFVEISSNDNEAVQSFDRAK